MKWIKVNKVYFQIFYSFEIEMEENAKEVERDLRENIDLIQNQLREVCFFSFCFIREFFLLERTTN